MPCGLASSLGLATARNEVESYNDMPTTIAQSFLTLKENLEITGLQKSTVSTRQNAVRDVVAEGLEVLDSFLTGSYSRSTMIAPLKEADIDIFVVLNAKYYHNYNGQNGGPAGLIDLVKRTLKRTYTRTPDISRNGQAVTIRFEDFAVDVVPGFNRQGGGYLIPNAITQSWIATDPKKHVEIIGSANSWHGGNFVPLVKMIKGWNRQDGRHLGSFHLEVLALQALSGITISDYSSGVRYFFEKGQRLVAERNLDPAGYGGDVGGYLNTRQRIEDAVRRFSTAYTTALRAEAHAARGDIRSAVEAWSRVFGDYFPAYG